MLVKLLSLAVLALAFTSFPTAASVSLRDSDGDDSQIQLDDLMDTEQSLLSDLSELVQEIELKKLQQMEQQIHNKIETIKANLDMENHDTKIPKITRKLIQHKSHHHPHHPHHPHHHHSTSNRTQSDSKVSIDSADEMQTSLAGYQQVWSDEFNGNSLDLGNWGIEINNNPPNNEHEAYIADTISVGNGHLTITPRQQNVANKNYVSGRINTSGKHNWLYGKFVTRAKTASFTGAWPAIWMLGENIGSVGWPKCGEIDVMEMVNQSSDNYASIHFGPGNDIGGTGKYTQNHNYHSNSPLGNDYHEYSVEWTADHMTFAVDGQDYKTFNLNEGDDLSAFKGASNFFLIINLAIGGDWPGHNIGQLGQLEVDWVRVYQ